VRHKGWFYIEYKYDGEGWLEYDRTQVENWAKVQSDRCASEHREAEIRVRKVK
jgi:hypothetical protein